MHPRRRLWLKRRSNTPEAAVAPAVAVTKEVQQLKPVAKETPLAPPVVEPPARTAPMPMRSKKVVSKAAAVSKSRDRKTSSREEKK